MVGGYACFYVVGGGVVAAGGLLHRAQAFGDEALIPAVAILLGEQNEIASSLSRASRRAACSSIRASSAQLSGVAHIGCCVSNWHSRAASWHSSRRMSWSGWEEWLSREQIQPTTGMRCWISPSMVARSTTPTTIWRWTMARHTMGVLLRSRCCACLRAPCSIRAQVRGLFQRCVEIFDQHIVQPG